MSPEQQLANILLEVMDGVGRDMVDDIRDTLSTDYPPPSEPGQFPHRRSGALEEGIEYVVRQSGSRTTLEVASTAPHSEFLENGTDKMKPRKFMKPALDRWEPIVAQRLEKAMNR